MKFFVILLLGIFVQADKSEPPASSCEIRNRTWDNATEIWNEISANITENLIEAYTYAKEEQLNFYKNKERYVSVALDTINQTTLAHINQIDEWIEKAEEQKVDPGRCIRDRKTLAKDVPSYTVQNIATCWMKIEPTERLKVAFNKLEDENRRGLSKKLLRRCNEKSVDGNNNCIKDMKKVFGRLIRSIQNDERKIEDILKESLDGLEACIKVNIEKLKIEDEKLTNKAIDCIKNLINKP